MMAWWTLQKFILKNLKAGDQAFTYFFKTQSLCSSSLNWCAFYYLFERFTLKTLWNQPLVKASPTNLCLLDIIHVSSLINVITNRNLITLLNSFLTTLRQSVLRHCVFLFFFFLFSLLLSKSSFSWWCCCCY